MHLLLPNPRGFCAGVRMAVDVIDQVLDLFPGETVYAYHEIVHNKHVVGRFVARGVEFVESIEEIPRGAIAIFSAHGVSPAVRAMARDRNLRVIDATCPLVTKVHAEAIRYARQGYQILLVGHKDHQEVAGTMGEAPDATQVVESPEDIVSTVCKTLLDRFGGTIEVADIFEETIEFNAPAGLRKVMQDKGVDPESRRFRVEPPTINQSLYGATPITVSARRN